MNRYTKVNQLCILVWYFLLYFSLKFNLYYDYSHCKLFVFFYFVAKLKEKQKEKHFKVWIQRFLSHDYISLVHSWLLAVGSILFDPLNLVCLLISSSVSSLYIEVIGFISPRPFPSRRLYPSRPTPGSRPLDSNAWRRRTEGLARPRFHPTLKEPGICESPRPAALLESDSGLFLS